MYRIFRDNLGKVDAVNRMSDGASLPYNPQTKSFDETHPLVIELREWEKKNSPLDLSDRPALPTDLAAAKLQKQQEIINLAAAKQEALTEGYSPTEQSTWDKKEQEAQSFLKYGILSDAKYLKAEAIAMSGAKTSSEIAAATKELATVIVARGDALRLTSAAISGTRARKWKEVEVLSSLESVNAYPVEEGWNV